MRLINTWLRITAVCWLVSLPMMITLSLLSVAREVAYVASAALFAVALVAAGRLLACPSKPLAAAVPASILTITLLTVALDRLPAGPAQFLWVVENLFAVFMIVLLFARGAADARPFDPWALVEFLAPFTALVFGAASIWAPAQVSTGVAQALAPASFAATVTAGVFALVFELTAPADSLTSEVP
jgi:hypothetical protein